MKASQYGHTEVVKLLMAEGANVHALDKVGACVKKFLK
jgi:hypothetical protein